MYTFVDIRIAVTKHIIHIFTDKQVKSSYLQMGQTHTNSDSRCFMLYITHIGKYWRVYYSINGKPQIINLIE